MLQRIEAPQGANHEAQLVTCPNCNGQRGFKRQCGGFLSDWIWEECRECRGTGRAQEAPVIEQPAAIEITYEQLWTLVAGANAYVAHMRRDQRRNGIQSWAVAKDVDHVQRVAAEVGALISQVDRSAVRS
jgi:hypothetical protein